MVAGHSVAEIRVLKLALFESDAVAEMGLIQAEILLIIKRIALI